MNAVRQLFAKKPAAAVKRPRKITRDALEAAIAACSAGLAADCTSMRTLDKLADLVPTGAGVVSITSPAPVTVAELDEVIAENVELPASTLAPLKRVRTLLAQAEAQEAQKAKEPVQYVTQAQLNTLVRAFAAVLAQAELAAAAPPGTRSSRLGYRLNLVISAPGEFGLSETEVEAFKRLVRLIDRASGKDGEYERRQASGREWRGYRPPQ